MSEMGELSKNFENSVDCLHEFVENWISDISENEEIRDRFLNSFCKIRSVLNKGIEEIIKQKKKEKF